jgi:hypothetical protein
VGASARVEAAKGTRRCAFARKETAAWTHAAHNGTGADAPVG